MRRSARSLVSFLSSVLLLCLVHVGQADLRPVCTNSSTKSFKNCRAFCQTLRFKGQGLIPQLRLLFNFMALPASLLPVVFRFPFSFFLPCFCRGLKSAGLAGVPVSQHYSLHFTCSNLGMFMFFVSLSILLLYFCLFTICCLFCG